MKFKESMQLAWENKTQILQGIYNTYLSHKPEIEQEAKRRREICETNQCGYYDKEGKPETSVVVGEPACSKCHCNIVLKSNCMSCYCSLGDKEKPGDRVNKEYELWSEMISNEQEKAIKQYEWEQQFKKG